MENKELKFKTNLQCENCVSKVKNDLDNKKEIEGWNVDTDHEDKILKVNGKDIKAEDILDIIKSKGFNAEVISL